MIDVDSAGLVRDVAGAPPLDATAVFNPARTHRYLLTRSWGDNGRTCTFVMLNPSTADAFTADRTIQRCLGFAYREGCDRLAVVNLFALRATNPDVLRGHPDPVGGAVNDTVILAAARAAHVVIAAWGPKGTHLDRAATVARALTGAGVDLHALTVTRDGSPGHPLYIRADTPLRPHHPRWKEPTSP